MVELSMSEEHVFDKFMVELSIVELLSFVDLSVELLIVELSVVELSIVENLIVELSMVELSTKDATIIEHCFTVELSKEELSVIDELSVIEEELSIVELSTVKELFDGHMSVEIIAESSLTDDDVSASLDALVSPVESSDDDPPPPPPPLPHEIKRSPKIKNIIRKRKFFIFPIILNVF